MIDAGAIDGGAAGPAARFSSLTGMIRPNSVAVLGASGDPTRIGGRPIAYLLKQGFAGAIYPVNPSRPEVQGLRAYEAVSELPTVPDVAVAARAAPIGLQSACAPA